VSEGVHKLGLHARRTYEALKRWLSEPGERLWRLSVVLCGLAAFAAIWLHHYPVGIDLPQHANLCRLWWAVWAGPTEYRDLYQINWFTPYLLTYSIGGVFTGLFGGLIAAKILLTLGVFGTALMMRRWLISIGGDPKLAVFGFVVGFGYMFIWGFLPNLMSVPVLLAYLAEFERQGERPGLRSMAATAAVGLALFFTHGIAFGPAMIAAGLMLFRRRFPFIAFRKGLHLIPIVLVVGIWILRQQTSLAATKPVWFLNFDRLVSLWSGLFWPFADAHWEHIALAGMAVFFIFARPEPVFESRRWIPFLVALACFLIVPETVGDIWLVGNRCLVFVQALAPGVLRPRPSGPLGKAYPCVSAGLVLAAMVLLNVRTADHNRELRGLRKLTARIEPESDIENVPGQNQPGPYVQDGREFGWNQIGQTPGWVTAEQGGILDNDSARFFHVPLQRRPGPWITRYRYVIVRGTPPAVGGYAAGHNELRFIGQKDDWYLYEHPPLRGGDVEAVRSIQGYGELRSNTSVDRGPLSIGGQRFTSGFGTHAPSLIRVRLLHPGRVFEGAYGIDDEGWKTARVRFRIRDDRRRVLLLSEPVSVGTVHRFSVPLTGQRQLLLEVFPEGSNDGAHADWVELSVK
jgi:NPCBM/NEW2 domain